MKHNKLCSICRNNHVVWWDIHNGICCKCYQVDMKVIIGNDFLIVEISEKEFKEKFGSIGFLEYHIEDVYLEKFNYKIYVEMRWQFKGTAYLQYLENGILKIPFKCGNKTCLEYFIEHLDCDENVIQREKFLSILNKTNETHFP